MYSLTMDLNLLHRSAWSNQQQFSAEHSAVSKPESITSGWERDQDVFVLLIFVAGFYYKFPTCLRENIQHKRPEGRRTSCIVFLHAAHTNAKFVHHPF